MVGILNISQGSTMGLHAALLLAKSEGQPVTTLEAAGRLKVSAAHLSKILQRLVKAGIAKAARGPRGGYMLNKPLKDIRLLDVFEAIEGKIKLSKCLLREPRCGLDGCILGDLLADINYQVLQHFEKPLSEL
jgi:Rrf2 family protein